jgi:hypothetical protein
MTNDLEQKKTGLRKIGDSEQVCLSPEHNPPSHIVLEPGTYEYVCPSCGKRIEFIVQGVYFGIGECSLSTSSQFCGSRLDNGRCGAAPFHDKTLCPYLGK